MRKLAVKLLDSITKISEYTILREKQNLENCLEEKNQYMLQISEKPSEEVRIPEFFITEAEIVNVSLDLLLSLLDHSPEIIETIYSYPGIESLLLLSLIQTDNFILKKKMADGLVQLFEECCKNIQVSVSAQEFFLPILWYKFFKLALENGQQSEVYFDLLQKNVELMGKPHKSPSKKAVRKVQSVSLEEMLAEIVERIKGNTFYERNHNDRDHVLIGMLNLISSLLQKVPDKALEVGQHKGLLSELLGPCLFETPRKSLKANGYPKCKSYFSRMAAFNLIRVLAPECPLNLRTVIEYLSPLHLKADWRTKSISDWNIIPKINEKSATGYVGLKNLGCICYMNSLMQQFYMIPSFRKAVLEVEDRNFTKIAKEDNLLYQLKCLFLALNESEKQYFNPKSFCQAFKDWEGNPTNVYEQRDVDEFFNMFLDKLETSIKGSSNEHFIKKHFGGVLSNELICKGCPHYSEREEQFLAISLQVKNKKSIQESLNSFVEGEMLDGENAYLCEKCEKKVPTLKRVCLKKLPNHMILVLKRFEFDFDSMTKLKVNDSCEFPMTINFEAFTQQGLRKQERKKNQEKGSESLESEDPLPEYDQKYFEYRLRGIVIHLGIADSGHYYSLIQERGSDGGNNAGGAVWFEFNDTIVKAFDEKDIPDEAFGGEEKWSYFNASNIKEKIKNAYLLFYERITPLEEEVAPPKSLLREESKDFELIESTQNPQTSDGPRSLESSKNSEKIEVIKPEAYLDDFLKEILKDNLKFHIHKNIFSPEYLNFAVGLISMRKYEENHDSLEPPFVYDEKKQLQKHYDLECLKLGMLFLLTCIFRERERQNNGHLLPFIKQQLARNLPACQWLLYSFTNRQILDEFVLSCLEKNMRDFTCGILRTCMKRVYSEEAEGSRNRLNQTDSQEIPNTILANFMNLCISLIPEARGMTKDYTEFFQIFYYFAKLGPECAQYLIKKKVIGRLLDFFQAGVKEFQEVFRKMGDVKFREADPSPLGQPAEVKKRALTGFDELRQKKKEKFLMENYNSSSKIYIWQTIAELILYCRFQKNEKPCKWQKSQLDLDLLPEEKTLLWQDHEPIYKMMMDATSKIAVRSVCQIYAYLCYENQKLSEVIINLIRKGLVEKNTNDYRILLGMIKKFLGLEDSLMEFRIEKIFLNYQKAMQDNLKYYNEFVCLQEFLLKISARFVKFRNFVSKNAEFCNWIGDYIRSKELAGGSIQENLKFRATRFLPWNRFAPSPKNFQEYREYCEKKLIKFKKLGKGDLEAETVEWDSDDDLSEYNFKPDDKFDYYYVSMGKWVTGQVKIVVEEMIQAKLFSNDMTYSSGIWIPRKSENLAPYMSMQEQPDPKEKGSQDIDGNKENKVKGKKSGDGSIVP